MMTIKRELLGNVVLMTVGREQGQLCVIIGMSREGYLLLADGRKRTVEKPKRKNVRHVRIIMTDPIALQKAKQEQRPFRNEEIRAAITEAQRG